MDTGLIRMEMTPEEVSAVVSQLPQETRGTLAYVDGALVAPASLAKIIEKADRKRFRAHVPASVTALQLRREVRDRKAGEKVRKYLETASDEEVEAWEYGTTISASNPLFGGILKVIAGSENAIDDLMRSAARQIA